MPAICIILVLAAIVWAAVYVRDGALWFGGLLFLVVGFCFGHSFLHFRLASAPMTIDRLVMGGLLLVYVLQRFLRRCDPKPLTWADLTMFAFAGLLVVSTFTHECHVVNAVHNASPVWRLVAGFLMPIGLFWIARQSRFDCRGLGVVYGFLTLFGVYIAATAIAEGAQQWWLVFPKYIADPKLGIHFGRARGAPLQSQSLGLYLDVLLLCAWAWRPYLGRLGRPLLALLVPAFLAAIALTYTRSVWIGLVLGGMVVLWFSLQKSWRPLLVLALLSMGLVATVYREQLVSLNREGGGEASRSSAACRGAFAYVSWKMFLDRPLLGVGFGQFRPAATDYLADRDVDLNLNDIRWDPNHNTFLTLLTETGLIGMGLFLTVLAGWTIMAWRLWRSEDAPEWARRQGLLLLGVLGAYLAPAVFFDMTYSPEDHWLVFFVAGVTAGLYAQLAGRQPAGKQAVRSPEFTHRNLARSETF
jgi:O-antigen ligase